MSRDNIQEFLVETGRMLIKQGGIDSLTARKLSEASGCSVGTIYNQFGNMDNFILIQNYMTLDGLLKILLSVKEPRAYQRLNLYVEKFTNYVLENRNFWFMVFSFHLKNSEWHFSMTYLRCVSAIVGLFDKTIKELYPRLKNKKRQVCAQVLWITLFSLSSLLTTPSLETYSKIGQTKVCKFLINTYLTGMKVLEKV